MEYEIIAEFLNGMKVIEEDNKLNLLNSFDELLSPDQWFDTVYEHDDRAFVIYDNYMNYVNADGTTEFEKDDIEILPSRYFKDYFGIKRNSDNTYNFLDFEGNILSEVWFDSIEPGSKDFSYITLDGELYEVDENSIRSGMYLEVE